MLELTGSRASEFNFYANHPIQIKEKGKMFEIADVNYLIKVYESMYNREQLYE